MSDDECVLENKKTGASKVEITHNVISDNNIDIPIFVNVCIAFVTNSLLFEDFFIDVANKIEHKIEIHNCESERFGLYNSVSAIIEKGIIADK